MIKKSNASKIQLPLLTISVPVLNECQNIIPLYKKLDTLSKVMEKKCHFEFVFTDNASDDETWEILESLGEGDKRIRAYRFTSNIGFQNSILFNLSQAKGNAVVQIDADLQDPPELIEAFFDHWEIGNLIVYGIRTSRQEGWLITTVRKLGYRVVDTLSEHPIPRDAGDFRLLDRTVVDVLKSTKTPNPYLRGIVSRYGFKQVGIPYARAERRHGKSKFNLVKILSLGFNALNNHSNVPMRIGFFIGLSALLTSTLGSAAYVILKLKTPDFPIGFATIYILLLVSIAINSLMLSLVLNSLNRVYQIIRGEPNLVVASVIN